MWLRVLQPQNIHNPTSQVLPFAGYFQKVIPVINDGVVYQHTHTNAYIFYALGKSAWVQTSVLGQK